MDSKSLSIKDSTALVTQAVSEYKPFWDYSERTDEQLIVLWVQAATWGRQCVSRILDAKGAAPFVRTTKELISKIAGNPDADNLKYLYSFHPNIVPLRVLVWLAIERKKITAELFNRHKDFKAGMTLLAEEEGAWRAESVSDYHEILGIDRLPTRFPHKEEDVDSRDVATLGTMEFWRNRGATVPKSPIVNLPELPREWGFPVGANTSLWDSWAHEVAARAVEDICRDYLSLFRGGFDRAKEQAWQALRDHTEKWNRQKRDGKIDLLDIDNKSLEAIRRLDVNNVTELQNQHDAGQALKMAIEAKGETGYRFMQAMMETGSNISESSKIAEISRDTAYEILKEVRLRLQPDQKK